MVNLKISDLRKYLKSKSNEELQQEIVDIVKSFKDVKAYYNVKINPKYEEEMLSKYKKVIKEQFFSNRGFRSMDYSKVRNAIKDFKKISNTPKNIAELMLFYAEIGVEFTNTYGDIDEKFYRNIVKAYYNALEYIFDNDLDEVFRKKAQEIFNKSLGIAWGFEESMCDIFGDYYNFDFEEEE
ncbi:DUF6155 family protein [Oceanirhabdus sp. W0125-5]|uniref:DUF6155 family protein n=1 Tax=Oceanirhabdus sp. W0125-5 TaxID=2999116 RepID=UPI0022F2A67C|nr:DUF6155 family protein [Oceanirhabdus sp. W0125-5]WBW95200.1 DUF6155 family protein [Oceanirhabdus sp. W0125-5]